MTILLKIFIALCAVLFLGYLCLARPFALPLSKRKLPAQADAANLKRHVQKIVTEYSPRDSRHVGNLERAAEYIAHELRRSSPSVSFQVYTAMGRQYRNVIAEFDSPNGGEAIVIGAHYDAFADFPAADDNASGVAGLLELGRLLSIKKLPIKVILAAYSLEETPFFQTDGMGSAVHAESLLRSGQKVRLMISLEMIGYFSDEAGSQSYPLPFLKLLYPARGNFIAIVGPLSLSPATIELKQAFKRAADIPAASINAPAGMPGIDLSDHRSFWERGFDAVMITDTAFYRNTAYHTAHDTPESLDYEKMAQVVNGIYAYLLTLHGGL